MHIYMHSRRCVQRRDACHNARACCALAFEGEYTRRCPSGVIVIARPAVARVRSIVGAPRTRIARARVCTCTWEYPRVGVWAGTGIFPRPAQILLRAGINLLPAFRSRSQTFRAYGGERARSEGTRRAEGRDRERGERSGR